MPRKKVEVVDETKNIALALKELCEAKGLPESVVVDAMSEALKKAYFKYSDDYTDTVIKVDSHCCAGTSIKAHNAALRTMASCQVDVIGRHYGENL